MEGATVTVTLESLVAVGQERDELAQLVDELREALEFYANENNIYEIAMLDVGNKARETLAKMKARV